MGFNQTVDIGTDVASFFIFHPDDLAHRENDPLDWYAYEFACGKEFEAGNIIAFRTGGDGGYQLRLTDGDLTKAERDAETGSWEWGFTVRHEKVFVDNGDYLPSDEGRSMSRAPKSQWVEIPNGDYRVKVHPIERKDDSLPDYVVCFSPVKAPLHVAESLAPPDLLPVRSDPPTGTKGIGADDPPGFNTKAPLEKTYPLMVVENEYLLPGGLTRVTLTNKLYEAIDKDDASLVNQAGRVEIAVAPSDAVPGLATVCTMAGMSQTNDEPWILRLRGKTLVRITQRDDGPLLPVAYVEPVARKGDRLSEAQVKELQTTFEAWAEKQSKRKQPASFERERIAAMKDGSLMTARIIDQVPVEAEARFHLYEASDADRFTQLMELLK